MWLLEANASMYVVFAFATVVFGAPEAAPAADDSSKKKKSKKPPKKPKEETDKD